MATQASKIIDLKDIGMPRRLSPEASRMAALEAARGLLLEAAAGCHLKGGRRTDRADACQFTASFWVGIGAPARAGGVYGRKYL